MSEAEGQAEIDASFLLEARIEACGAVYKGRATGRATDDVELM